MSKLYVVITNLGDGSNGLEFYDGSKFSEEEIRTACENFIWTERYASGDGVQISTLEFPVTFSLESIKGIYLEHFLPGTCVEQTDDFELDGP